MAKHLKNIEDLTIAFLRNGLTSREEAKMRLLLKEPAHREFFRNMYMIWHAGNEAKKNEDVERALQKALYRINMPERRHQGTIASVRRLTFRRVAVAAVLVAGIALFLVVNNGGPGDRTIVPVSVIEPGASPQVTKVTVPLGATSTVELSDGTIITLNAGSYLQYDDSFGKNSREVQLEGEGYFKVAPNETLPFVVRVKDVTIKALGTEFNITAYPEEETVRTTLVNGSVSIRKDRDQHAEKELILKPSQTATVFKHDTKAATPEQNALQPLRGKQATALSSVNTAKEDVLLEESAKKTLLYTSWKDTRWIIEAEPLEELVVKLHRRYNVRIFIVDEALKQYPFNGIITDETLEQVLEIMKAAIPLQYAINKKDILLSIDPHQYEIFEKSKKDLK